MEWESLLAVLAVIMVIAPTWKWWGGTSAKIGRIESDIRDLNEKTDNHIKTESEVLARMNGVDARMEGIES